MDFNTILKQINDIFIDVLDHIQLIVAIEKKFKLRFTTAEISSWKTVGEMCSAIEKKLNG